MVSGLREASGGGCRHGGEGGKVRQRERRWLGGGRQLGEGPTAGSSGFQRTAVWSLWVARPAAPMPGAAGEASDGRGSPGFPEPGLHTITPNLACADIEMSQDTVNTTDGGLTRSGLTRADWDALLAEDASYLDPEDVAAKQDYPSDPEEFAEQSLNTKELVLSISKSIVSLVSSVDGKILLACTGTVVDHVASATWILTSASLVRKPGSDCDAYQEGEVKIEVFLHNKSAIDGCIAMCNLQYNIAIITVDSLDLPMMALNDPPGCYSMLACPVIAIGRDSKSLRVKHGDMTRERSKLDCSELLACTCPVSKIFIGGLIMDFERRIVGISFFGKDTTPVLPIEIAARCLQHFKCFGTLEQPCLCIRVRALHSMDLEVLDKMRKICPDLSCGTGIVVDQIPEALSMNCGGIEVGDIICSIDDVALHSVAQFTAILLDGMVVAMSPKNKGILQASVRRPGDETKLVAMLNMRENPLVDCNNFFCNRWMLP